MKLGVVFLDNGGVFAFLKQNKKNGVRFDFKLEAKCLCFGCLLFFVFVTKANLVCRVGTVVCFVVCYICHAITQITTQNTFFLFSCLHQRVWLSDRKALIKKKKKWAEEKKEIEGAPIKKIEQLEQTAKVKQSS